MKALTLQQPHPWALTFGGAKMLKQSWSSSSVAPRFIMVHAGGKWDRDLPVYLRDPSAQVSSWVTPNLSAVNTPAAVSYTHLTLPTTPYV